MPFFLLFLVSCATLDSVVTNPLLRDSYSMEQTEGQRVHLLNIDLNKYSVKPLKAKGLSLPTEISAKNHALAALNGGFFQANGTPAGLLVLDHKVIGYQGKPRAALGWSKDHSLLAIDRILYTMSEKEFVSVTDNTTAKDWNVLDFAIGGTPLLIRNFKVVEDFGAERVREPFLNLKHARSAICVKDRATWIFIAVEGSSSLELSLLGRTGFTMTELARYMANTLHCQHAINLDGGGSTALVIDNKIMNRTTFGEREVSDVLGVFPRTGFPVEENSNK